MVASYSVKGDSFVAEKPRVWTGQNVALTLSGAVGAQDDLAPDGKCVKKPYLVEEFEKLAAILLFQDASADVCESSRTHPPFQLYPARFIQHTVSAVAIAQIQSDGQGLPRNIPALLLYCGANLLHCRSISSHFISYLGQSNRIRA
jgi:hypothetical protein